MLRLRHKCSNIHPTAFEGCVFRISKPIVLKTITGDEYKVENWQSAWNLKRLATKQHVILGKPNSFDLYVERGNDQVLVDPRKWTKSRKELVSGLMGLEMLIVNRRCMGCKKSKSTKNEGLGNSSEGTK